MSMMEKNPMRRAENLPLCGLGLLIGLSSSVVTVYAHRDGPNPALLQPIRHRLQLRGGTPKAPYRLAVPARRYRYIVGFVADINARGIGMYHLQTDIFALDRGFFEAPTVTHIFIYYYCIYIIFN